MRTKRTSVCPNGCKGGYTDRQHGHTFTEAEIASLKELAPDGPLPAIQSAHRCTYCGCVYLRTDPPTVLGFKDENPVGPLSWVPKLGAGGRRR